MKNKKLTIPKFSVPHLLAAAVFLIILGAVIIISKSFLKNSFLVIGIILLEAALVKFTMYAAVKPYENKPEHLYTAIALTVSGVVVLVLSLFRISWIIMVLSTVPCVIGILGLRSVISSKFVPGKRNTLICVNAGLFVAGFVSALCSVIYSSNRIMNGVIFICSGALVVLECVLLAAYSRSSRSKDVNPDKTIDAEYEENTSNK